VQKLASRYALEPTQLVLNGFRVHNGGEAIGRNAALIHLALLQITLAEKFIYIGIHKGTSFYDCSSRFFELCSILVSEQSDGKVRLVAPLLELTKREIVDFAQQIALPFSETYSCQSGREIPCGICLSCLDREALGC
jgi:7-cyano-7-deazaguanine synthase